MTKLKDVHVECEFHGKDFEACKQYSGEFACEPVISVIEGVVERKATKQLTYKDVEKAGQEGNALFERWLEKYKEEGSD